MSCRPLASSSLDEVMPERATGACQQFQEESDMRWLCGVLAASSIALTACAPLHSGAFVDRDISFSSYHTYGWLPESRAADRAQTVGGADMRDRVFGEVERQLSARGLRGPITRRPDLLLRYRAAVTPRLEVSTGGTVNTPLYGDCSFDCFTRVEEYETATLIVDAIDARTRKLVWRGWTRDDLERLAEGDSAGGRVRKAIADMMARFPGGDPARRPS